MSLPQLRAGHTDYNVNPGGQANSQPWRRLEQPADPYAIGEDDPEDVANEEEEEAFERGMQRQAQDMEAHDVDQDNKLDFGEFCNLVREREVGDFTEEELRERFNMLDADGSGKVDLSEYIG